MSQQPTFVELHAEISWKMERAGVCSPLHFKRMELQRIGTLQIDTDKVRRVFPGMKPGTSQAIGEISLANALSVAPPILASSVPNSNERLYMARGARTSIISGIEQILQEQNR